MNTASGQAKPTYETSRVIGVVLPDDGTDLDLIEVALRDRRAGQGEDRPGEVAGDFEESHGGGARFYRKALTPPGLRSRPALSRPPSPPALGEGGGADATEAVAEWGGSCSG